MSENTTAVDGHPLPDAVGLGLEVNVPRQLECGEFRRQVNQGSIRIALPTNAVTM